MVTLTQTSHTHNVVFDHKPGKDVHTGARPMSAGSPDTATSCTDRLPTGQTQVLYEGHRRTRPTSGTLVELIEKIRVDFTQRRRQPHLRP